MIKLVLCKLIFSGWVHPLKYLYDKSLEIFFHLYLNLGFKRQPGGVSTDHVYSTDRRQERMCGRFQVAYADFYPKMSKFGSVT